MRRLFYVLAAVFIAAGVFHAYAAATASSGVGRHALFVGVNALAASLLVRRPPGTAIVFALFCGQQLVSHGGSLGRAWRESHRIPLDDAGVLVVMPLTVAALVLDARRKRRRRAKGAESQGGPV